MTSDENETRFQNWAKYIRRTVGDASDKILRYFWDLYSTLMAEINNNSNHNNNGKKP